MYSGKYGKLKYGLKDGATKIIKLEADLSEKVLSIAGFGETFFIASNCYERMLSSFDIHNATLIECELTEELIAESKIGTCYSVKAELVEDIGCESNAAKVVYLIDDLCETVNANCYLGKNIFATLNVADSLDGQLFIGKVIPLEILVAEQINADISANVLEKEIARIEVTIPPGGELRIDSSVFNATLNGENILHLYNGDWITISRDTTTLTVQTASGGKVTGQLLYTERYL